MRFQAYDSLRLFTLVARHHSFTAAGEALNLTKGAVSYQIGRLEEALGFALFERRQRGIALTRRGKRLLRAGETAFGDLEREVARLRQEDLDPITIGLSSYFASRWLSPRLMTFIADHPRIRLRLQPLIDLIDLRAEGIDLAIRWGRGDWTDLQIEPLLACPAFPTAGVGVAQRVEAVGLAGGLSETALLHDREGSEAWHDWHRAAGLSYRAAEDGLVVPDPNVRVQAVIDGQGVALNDRLVADEIAAGRLFQISDVQLADYGYFLAYPPGTLDSPTLSAFRDWILSEAGLLERS